MTDIVEALYIFAQEKRIPKYIYNHTEYQDATKCASKCEQTLRATLTDEQNRRLDALLDERLTYHTAELEAVFQAGFSMALELIGS